MALLLLWGITACTISDETLLPDVVQESVPVSLTLSVAAQNGSNTRMSSTTTQNKDNFRGIQDLWLVPFKKTFTESDKKIAVGDSPMSLIQDTGESINDKEKAKKFFFQPNMMKMFVGTSAFLVYGKATNSGIDKENNGSLTASYDADNNYTSEDFTPANVTFSPEVIPAAADDATKATQIAAYLTQIATAGNWYNNTDTKDLFNEFANIHNAISERFAGSSINILKHVNKTYETVNEIAEGALKTAILNAIKNPQYVTFADGKITALQGSAEGGYNLTGYPATLPEGVAGMLWNGSAFESKPGNNMGSYVYPAELYYYANSRIYTSTQAMEDKYVTTATEQEPVVDTWGSFIAKYENKGTDNQGTTVEADTRSIALIDSLNYGVACLEVKIRAKVPTESSVANAIYAFDDNYGSPSVVLKDAEADGKGTFPLTAILVGGQNKQGFDFTPKYPDETATDYSAAADPEYIIYDKTIADENVCLGDYIAQGTNANYSPSLYTLTLQTKRDKSVKLVLEFKNNTTSPFKCKSGIIYPGTKFYLMASVVNLETSDKEKDQQVLTKDHKSTVLLTISNLENAYNALPSLSSDKVRVFETVTAGISSWQQGINTSTELHNW